MKTITVRGLQKRIRDCVDASQHSRVVVTRHGAPAALIIGVEGSDWETLALQTNPSFWRMIEQRRTDRTISLDELKRLVHVKHSSLAPTVTPPMRVRQASTWKLTNLVILLC